MSDELDVLQELCADIVSEKRYEPALLRLFGEKPGAWMTTKSLCEAARQPVPGAKATVTWLPAPGEPDYAVILFFDPDSLWSTTALYNTSRLHKSPGLIGSGAA